MILLGLKNYLKDKSFYFSPSMNTFYTSTFNKANSTGETVLNQIYEIINQTDLPILLLDEWDANLDFENMQKIDTLLSVLSKDRCIVEVRHRNE